MPFGSTCVYVWRRWRVFVKRMKMNCWDKHRHSKKYIFSHLVFLSYVSISQPPNTLLLARRKIRIFCVVVSFQPIPRDSIFLKWNRSIVELESSSAIALENESFFPRKPSDMRFKMNFAVKLEKFVNSLRRHISGVVRWSILKHVNIVWCSHMMPQLRSMYV